MVPAKFERPKSSRERFHGRLRQFLRFGSVGAFSAAVGFATHVVFPMLRALYRRRIRRGETIELESLGGPPVRQTFTGLTRTPANLAPKAGRRRQAAHMKVAYPEPTYDFTYATPPISGNVVNGLGETTRRRADYVFFGDGYGRAWGKLDWFFQVMEPTIIHRLITRLFWQDRNRVGPVAHREPVHLQPDEAAAQIKAWANEAGASLVGITPLTQTMRYHDFDQPWVNAICIGIPMDREDMVHTPSVRSGVEIQRAYLEANRIAIAVAKKIRALGWPARASTNISPDATEVLHIPVAIGAGLGQLGKHGSLLTREHGSNVRLAVVLTDMPATADGPADIGAEDFCANCRVCVDNCPPNAIFDEKQLVRGERKWYVDFDACVPYFAKTEGCGICIHACPWSEPGRGFVLSDRLLARRARKSA